MIYGLHSLCIKKVLNNWATQNHIISKDWRELMRAFLESGPPLQRLAWWKDEASATEKCNWTRGINIVKDQLLGDDQYSELRAQIIFDDAILEQYHTIA